MAAMDTDNTGDVNFMEFEHWWSSLPAADQAGMVGPVGSRRHRRQTMAAARAAGAGVKYEHTAAPSAAAVAITAVAAATPAPEPEPETPYNPDDYPPQETQAEAMRVHMV